MKVIRKYKKGIATLFLLSFINQVFIPNFAFAGNGGSVQAEYSKGGGASKDLVNLYNGQFNYPIDLMTVPGPGTSFPIKIVYRSADVSMMSVPTSVGEGWSLEIPKITRSVMAIPDDFKGDEIVYDYDIKDFNEVEIDLGKNRVKEFVGLPNPFPSKDDEDKLLSDYNLRVGWNSYQGDWTSLSATLSSAFDHGSANLTINYNSKSGISYVPGLSLKTKKGKSSNFFKRFFSEIGLSGSVNKNNISAGASFGKLLNFNFQNSGVPQAGMPMRTITAKGQANLPNPISGGKVDSVNFVAEGPAQVYKTSFTHSSLVSHNVKKPAYGFLYKENAEDRDHIKDFIRNEIAVKKGTPFLPVSQKGKDVFIQTGGYGGTFTVDDNAVQLWSTSVNKDEKYIGELIGDFGVMLPPKTTGDLIFHLGLGVKLSAGKSYSGPWRATDNQSGFLTSNDGVNIKRGKMKASELTVDDSENMYSTWKGISPLVQDIKKQGMWGSPDRRYKLKDRFLKDAFNVGDRNANTDIVETNDVQLQEDEKKLKYVQYFTTKEAVDYGFKSNYINQLTDDQKSNRSNHIAEIHVFERDQSELIYGEPVYTLKKVDANFSLNSFPGGEQNEGDGLKYNQYEYDLDIGNSNSHRDENDLVEAGEVGMEMLNKTTVPEHANTWLVSRIPTRDYEDINGDGLSSDDKGDCVVFNYETVKNSLGEDIKYRFRTPYNNVNVNQGVKGYARDNMASYSCGENQLKYIKSIETKTHKAIFYYNENRLDGLESGSEIDGGLPSDLNTKNRTWALNEIKLFVKKGDGTVDEGDFLQKVVLTHDNSLCQNLPSNRYFQDQNNKIKSGKLTLKSINSFYRNSLKGNDYSYQFNYKEDEAEYNPDFNKFNIDRWGDYQDNMGLYSNSVYPFKDLPYTDQASNSKGGEWLLREIKLPSGANMIIDYEKNTYANVEDKSVTQMYDIIGVDKIDENSSGWEIELENSTTRNVSEDVLHGEFRSNFHKSLLNKDYIVVKLDAEIFNHIPTVSARNQKFYDSYIKDLDNKLYIKAYTYLKGEYPIERNFDWVDLTAQLDKNDSQEPDFYRVVEGSNGDFYGEIQIAEKQPFGMAWTLNPIRLAGFEKLKSSRQDLLYGQPKDGYILSSLVSVGSSYKDVFGPSLRLWGESAVSEIRTNGWSKIRLKNPKKEKVGGGVRVKSITLEDNWVNDPNNITIDDNYKYILSYDYSTLDEIDSVMVTSGVAVEPFFGQEENANWNLITYKQSSPSYIFEGNFRNIHGNPLNVFNGGASVSYSEVRVNTKFPIDENDMKDVKFSQPPYQEYHFFTSKDFPVIKRSTGVFDGWPSNFAVNVPGYINVSYYDKARSQGYTVVTNDMPGKLKSLVTKNRNGDIINGQVYEYATEEVKKQTISYGTGKKIRTNTRTLKGASLPNNSVSILSEENMIQKGQIGISEDIWIDNHENYTSMAGVASFEMNLGFRVMEITPYFMLHYVMPVMFLPATDMRMSEKQTVTIKKIHKSGVLQKVTTLKDESKIETKYQVFDSKTGRVLLSSVDNEFGDPIYKFSHPAYFEYGAFSEVGKSIDVELGSILVGADGKMDLGVVSDIHSDYHKVLHGDKVVYKTNVNNEDVYNTGFIIEHNRNDGILDNEYKAIIPIYPDTDEQLVSTSIISLRVLQSGNTNLVDASLGEIVAQSIDIVDSVLPIEKVNILKYKNSSDLADAVDSLENLNIQTPHTIKLVLNDSTILNTSAVTFKSDWELSCCSGLLNPFRNGTLNYWRPFQSFVYHGKRDYSEKENSRKDGRFLNYEPFRWNSVDYPQNGSPWVLSSEATYFDRNGNLLEQKDAIGLFSSSGYGYGGSLVSFVVGNSMFNQSGFDGFEDYEFESCNYGAFSFEDNVFQNSVSSEESHSGRKCLKLESGQSIEKKVYIFNCSE